MKDADVRGAFAGLDAPAARMQFVMDLYAPVVELEDGTHERDPSFGLITKEAAIALLSERQ